MNLKKIIKLVIYSYRRLLFRFKGSTIPFSTEISKNTTIYDTVIGDYGFVSPNCCIYDAEIGNYLSLGGSVQIGAMEHPVLDLSTNTFLCNDYPKSKKTIIGNDVWIAGQSIVKQGVHIGDGAVIGANSFVNKDIPPFAVAVGSPAKVLKYRFPEDVQEALSNSKYRELSPAEAKIILDKIRKGMNYGTEY